MIRLDAPRTDSPPSRRLPALFQVLVQLQPCLSVALAITARSSGWSADQVEDFATLCRRGGSAICSSIISVPGEFTRDGHWCPLRPCAIVLRSTHSGGVVMESDEHYSSSRQMPCRRKPSAIPEFLDPKYRDEFDAWRNRYKNPFKDLKDTSLRTRNWTVISGLPSSMRTVL